MLLADQLDDGTFSSFLGPWKFPPSISYDRKLEVPNRLFTGQNQTSQTDSYAYEVAYPMDFLLPRKNLEVYTYLECMNMTSFITSFMTS